VGVKLAMTVAMQSGTFILPLQEGAPGATGLANDGLLPNVLFGPKLNPVLPGDALLFPPEEYPQVWYA